MKRLAERSRAEQLFGKESDERLIGRYAECARLLTSPRMNRPQQEIVESDAEEYRTLLEARGMTFVDGPFNDKKPRQP